MSTRKLLRKVNHQYRNRLNRQHKTTGMLNDDRSS
jgi:hypothetical protein